MNEDDFYSNCKKIELIKRGPLSTVYLARRLAPADKSKTDNDEIFILKEIFLNPKKNLKIEDIKVSVQAMQTISHPSIHKIFGFNEGDRELFQPPRIYSQYACFRSLDLINPSNLGKHWQTIRMKIIYGVAFAMNLLHCYKPSFIHNDLRPEHILLNEKYEPLLTGFGFPKNYYLHRYVKRYTSPDILKEENENSAIEESLNSHKVDQTCESKPENDYECEEIDKNDIEFQKSCDVFSYGMVLAFLFSGNNPPFAEIADEDTAARIIASGSKLKLPNTTPKPYKKLIRSCTNVHWKKRPKFFDILYKLDTPDFKLPRIDEDEFLEYRKNMVTCKPVVIHTNESHDEIDKLQLVPADKYINKLVEQVSHGHNHGHCNGHCNGNCHCSINRTANTILTVNAQKGHVNTGKKNDERRKSIQLTRPPLPITAKPNTINKKGMESINGIDAQVLVSHSKPTFIFKHKNMIHVKPQPASPPPNMKSGSNAPKKVAANPFLSPPLEEDKFGEDLCTIPETTSGFKLSKAANTMSAPPISLTQATAPLQNDLIRSSNVFNLNNQLNNSDNEIERENLVIDNHALTNFSSINSNNINPSKYNHLSNSNLIKPSVIQHNLLNNNLLQKNINHIPFGHLPITSAMKGNAQLLKPLGGIRSGDELFEDAMRCETGESVFLNVIRSSMLFKSAADAGHDGAIFWYAKKLTYGIGIRPNPREAAKMFKTASEHGTKDAAFMFYEALMKSGGNIREVIFFIKAGLRENDLSSNFAVVKCVEENGEIMWPVCEALLSLKFCLRRCYKPFSPTYFNFAKKYLTTSDLSTLLSESRNDSSISYFLAVLITEKLVDLSFIHNKDNEAKKLLEDSFEAGYKPAFDYFLKCQYSLNEYDFSKTHHLIIHGCEFARNGNAILAVEEWQKAVNQDCKWNPDFQSLKTVSQQLNNHVDNDPSYENASQIFLSLLEYWAKAGSGEAKEILGEILISGRNGLEKNISWGLMHLKAAFDNENYEMENYQLLKDNCTGFYGEK